MSLLEIDQLEVEIAGRNLLKNVSFNVGKSELIGIIGPNGSGKTTLFNTISGFINSKSGKIRFNGKDITKTPPYKRAELGIGRVFQNFGIFRDMSVLENMTTALESRQSLFSTFLPWSKANKTNVARSLGLLEEINLQNKAKEKASNLSGGQMRLLEIMRCLAFEAELFLLDEPTAGVSPKMKDDVVQIINKLKSLNKTILIIEHDINFIQKFCQRIIVLDGGNIIMDDTPENVRKNPQLQEIYFGS